MEYPGRAGYVAMDIEVITRNVEYRQKSVDLLDQMRIIVSVN